jgi:beta-glucosidase
MDGLTRRCGKAVTVEYIDTGALGSADSVNLEPIPADNLFCYHENEKVNGLSGKYHNNNLLVFQPIVVRNDPVVSFNWGKCLPVDHELFSREEGYSARWQGTVKPERSGLYSIGVEASGKVRMYIDSELMIDRWEDPVFDREIVSCVMEEDAEYHITLEYASLGRDSKIMLGWQMQGDESAGIEMIAESLRGKDAAVIVAGVTEGEGKDRANINLPASMEQLIGQVSGTGIPTVVLINAGGVVTMRNWIDDVDAVLDLWYSGQEGGNAVADVLFGTVCPGGKLPVTFPQDVSQVPMYYNQEPSGRGYGYLEISGEPLFPFGHGLSYTNFEYRELKLSQENIRADESVTVSIEIANTGDYSGDEVVQLYIRDCVSTYTTPLKELKDFKRVLIEKGKTKTVCFELGPEKLALLDENFKPVVEPGEFEIMAGSSSKDIRLKTVLTVKKL